MKTLKEYLYNTVHRNKKPVKQLADEIGIHYNYLYRMCLESDDERSKSGSTFPLERLIPLMKAANDFSVIKYIASVCGFAVVKLPTTNEKQSDSDVKALKKAAELSGFLLVKTPVFTGKTSADLALLNEYQQASNVAVSAMLEFFKSPSAENLTTVTNNLHDVMIKAAEVKLYCKKSCTQQIEMEF